MASHSPSAASKSSSSRSGTARLQSSKTFDGTDDDLLKPPRRAKTVPNGPLDAPAMPDDFETGDKSDSDNEVETTRASIELDVLPIELVTVTDNFVEHLQAKVHSQPPSIDRLSRQFQSFYETASQHISTHINALATRASRDVSPSPSASSISSAASRLRSKASSLSAPKDKPPKLEAEQQMITAEELANKKRARKALDAKRVLLEEAVERRLCEGLYERIYRHRSTQDEAQDDKLRSKTAALAVVGIDPFDLGVDLGDSVPDDDPDAAAERIAEIRDWLSQARTDLIRMNESRYPLGKLNHLKAAHKSIVDTLAHFHPSASADEIMPMLIYTLITLPPENLHIISDIHFIQNFRWEPKLTGEAAYCLTNLEACMNFLQTVDLATLRADEALSGPAKQSSQPGTPKTETFPPAYPQGPSQSTPEVNTSTATAPRPHAASAASASLKAPNVLRNRRLSDLVNTPAQAFGAASDAVFTTADQGLKTISNSLGDSYKFLIGKVRERQDSPKESIVVPRTLDDARKLVSTPPPDDDDLLEDSTSTSSSQIIVPERSMKLSLPSRDDARQRDRSSDSTRSARSASSATKKVVFSEDSSTPAAGKGFLSSVQSPGAAAQNAAVLEQMRNLGNQFNPMARLSGIGPFRGFGRNATASPAGKDMSKAAADGGDLATAFPDIAAALPPKETPKIAPPNKRFMELQNPGDLKIAEVLELLRDYRRLAGALKKMDAFEEKR